MQMASYRDPQLIPTLKDLTSQANKPKHLNIVVCWQHGEEQSLEDFLDAEIDIKGHHLYRHYETDDEISEFDVFECGLNGANIEFVSVDYTETRGACWARNLIQRFYKDENYTLQLDSHHRFIEGWDTTLIEMLEGLKKESTKPVLTGYIPAFDPENDPKGRTQHPYQTDFDRFIPEGAVFFLPSEMTNWKELDRPIRARFYSGHFTFADGTFAKEVQHDPNYFFHGEEISIAARAFTHGYDLYTPHKVVAWHEYTRKGRDKVWDDHTTEAKKTKGIKKDWIERNNLSHKRNRILFGMDGEDPDQIDFGKYGFGNVRTLREYEEYAGINFKLRGVQQHTLDRKEPPYPFMSTTERDWESTFLKSNDVRISVHKDEFEDIPDNIAFCFVGVHDADGKELHRKDLTASEFYKKLESDWLDYPYICITSTKPVSYTVWPYTKNGVWLKKITKQIYL